MIKCITIKQPFASAILAGTKTIEYRSWPTKYRGTIAIHAGKSKELLNDDWSGEYPDVDVKTLPRGVILGTVEITDCTGDAGDYEWHLSNPQLFNEPIPFVGKLGIYPLPDGLLP